MHGITHLKIEYAVNPLGIDVIPRFSWSHDGTGEQSAYRILAASNAELLRRQQPDIWDSGRVENPALLAETIRADYGVTGAPGYQVEVRQGKVVGQEYRLELEPSIYDCFLGTVKGLDKLPGNLGCALLGMNDRWTVFFQQQDAKTKTRILPVEEKSAYCVMTAADEGKLIFIGHPVVADNPELVLNVALSKDWKSWLLEIHNPTDTEITTNVKSLPLVAGLKFTETIKLAPGTSQFRTLGPIND